MLELKNICYSVTTGSIKKDILKNINLSVKDNEIVVLTGPNGSGKSTLAKIIMGIILPDSGEIIFNNQNITELSITDRAKLGLGFAFQQPITFKGLCVKDLLDIASGKVNSLGEACEFLSSVGLCARDYVTREVNNKLSGGELKRIEIAQVLAKKSCINIFDEPEAGIDLWSFDSLVNIFKSRKSTNIIISHQQKIIEIADLVVLLKAGEIEASGTYKKVLPRITAQKCSRLTKGGK